MKRLFALFLLAAGAAAAQDFIATKETVLAGAAEVITVQQPAASAATVRFSSAYIDCSVACTITVERNGTAATTTSLTTVPLNSGTSKALAWSASNVGVGNIVAKFTIPAGGGVPLNLNGINMIGVGTAKNFTIRTNSITGTVHINIRWTEVQ